MLIKWTLTGDTEKIWKKLRATVDLPEELFLKIALQLLAVYFEQSSQGRDIVIKDRETGKIVGKIKRPSGKFKSAITIWNAPKP